LLKHELVEIVGLDHYRDACRSARRDAERQDYGRGDPGADDSSLVPHDLSDALWESDAPLAEKIRTLFEIYDEMPAYGLLMYVSHEYSHWPQAAKRQYWAAFASRLASSDRALARPLAYNLWCDWFEHGIHTADAWEALTAPAQPDYVLQEVLIASGPVPWELKSRLYARLIPEQKWHYYIFRSLLHSAFDVFGKFERDEATTLLAKLKLPDDTENLEELRGHLDRC
jgi:hypothetical protein